jgi:uncharacterized protein YndB with AHSA1/START domain
MADILHSIQISVPADAIYPLISTAQGLMQWWAADVIESGGTVELGFFNRQTVYRLRAQINQPPSRFEWACETGKEWAGTRLIFKLEPAGKGTLVRFTHAGWQSATDYFVACTTTWGELMFRLKAAAEGKARGPLFLASSLAY